MSYEKQPNSANLREKAAQSAAFSRRLARMLGLN
jgi:hypothetical protein